MKLKKVSLINNKIIEDILLSSSKKSNKLKPYKKELVEKNILKDYKFSLIELAYNYINKDLDIFCPICLKKYKFINENIGYYKVCSFECEINRIDLIKSEPFLLEEIKLIINESNQKQIYILKEKRLLSSLYFYTNFLDKTASFSERIYCFYNKIKELKKCSYCKTNNVNYKNNKLGYFLYCSHSCSFNSTKENRIETNTLKYGVKNVFQSKESIKNRNLIMKEEEFKEKCQITKNKKYGINKEDIYNKIKKTWDKKSLSDINIIIENRKLKLIEKYGNNYISIIKERSSVSNRINTIGRKIQFFEELNIKPNFNLKDYNGLENNKYNWICLKCNLSYYKLIDYDMIPYCPKCNILNLPFYVESTLLEFINSLSNNCQNNNRTIISPLELDVVVDNIAIEYNGIYHHNIDALNESKGDSIFIKNKIQEFRLNKNIGKSYHLLKTMLCNEKYIQLLHVFEDEWKNDTKQEIWKSIIRNKLNKNILKINARDCYIKELSFNDKKDFLEKNHLQGNDNSKFRYGLFLKKDIKNLYKDTLVSVMTFGKSRYDKNIEVELYRFCNLINISVRGSASKLLSYFINMNSPKSIVSYGDKRFGGDNFYEKIGFVKISNTIPGFRYIKNNKVYNRELFQKHLLKRYKEENLYGIKIFKEELTGEENLILNGFKRIYDCGNNKYLMLF